MPVCSINGVSRGSEREIDHANEKVTGNETNEGLCWEAVCESAVALKGFIYGTHVRGGGKSERNVKISKVLRKVGKLMVSLEEDVQRPWKMGDWCFGEWCGLELEMGYHLYGNDARRHDGNQRK